jgi:hypothetical protein
MLMMVNHSSVETIIKDRQKTLVIFAVQVHFSWLLTSKNEMSSLKKWNSVWFGFRMKIGEISDSVFN